MKVCCPEPLGWSDTLPMSRDYRASPVPAGWNADFWGSVEFVNQRPPPALLPGGPGREGPSEIRAEEPEDEASGGAAFGQGPTD